MACRNAWWMQPPSALSSSADQEEDTDSQAVDDALQKFSPHRRWPFDWGSASLRFPVLEKFLRESTGTACMVEQYGFDDRQWHLEGSTTQVSELLDLLKSKNSGLFIATRLCGEAVQALGHYLQVMPQLFNFRYSLGSFWAANSDVHFMVQCVEKYSGGHMPLEAQRSPALPQVIFRNRTGFNDHKWHISRIMAMCSTREGKYLIIFDPLDEVMAAGLKSLLRGSGTLTGEKQKFYSKELDLIYFLYRIISHNWSEFLDEADLHFQVLNKRCVGQSLTPDEQLQYTGELHQSTLLWPHVRRCLLATREIIEKLQELFIHSSPEPQSNFRPQQTFETIIMRCDELQEQNKILIKLIFNIATIQNTRASVDESKAANALGASSQRFAVLAFFYLPITLAAGILGMNVKSVTGDSTHSSLWMFFAIASILTSTTFVILFVQARLDRMARKKAGIQDNAVPNFGLNDVD